MKHINKKLLIRGAGKGAPKPQPAILEPPKLGGYKTVSSYSVAEIIDLISDGPIEGLVDQNGIKLKKDIFKGVYLDNTPIQNTQILDSIVSLSQQSIVNRASAISSIWIENEKFKEFSNYAGLFYYISANGYVKCPLLNTEYEDAFVRWFSQLPTYWRLSSNKVEIHRQSPLISVSPILNQFQTLISNRSRNGNDAAKSIANRNIKELDKIKRLMRDSDYATAEQTPSDKVSFFIIDLSGLTLSGIRDIDGSKDLDFTITGLSNKFDYVYTLTQPDFSGSKYSGTVNTIVIIAAPLKEILQDGIIVGTIPQALLRALNSANIKLEAFEKSSNISPDDVFNFSNVSCEFRSGRRRQSSLENFGKVFNDYVYEASLFGPFVKNAAVQRIIIEKDDNKFKDGIAGLNNNNLSVSQTSLLAGSEGSKDVRLEGNANNNYSNWNDQNERKNYDSLAFTHTIENPFVDKVSISILVNALSDTVHTTVKNVQDVGDLEAGSKIPSIVAIKIETGKITNGEKTNKKSYSYSIVGLIEGQCIIDFGADYSEAANLLKNSVKLISGEGLNGPNNDSKLTTPFDLPPLEDDENPSTTKRYIKIVKLSCETNSTLINKNISLAKVTEIIDEKFSYPFSAIVGVKLDARAFGSVPERSYDCKLKQVRIPSNYKIIDDSTDLDIRYVKNRADYNVPKKIYWDDWDGTFSYGWTDNPAWILYDLLTSERYGLGSYIDGSQVNKWELYKIARFCDAVDDEGYFIGVSDGVGGLEPRFSCNILFKEQTKVYDAINVIASLFRGIVFFGGSEIHFLDDRPRKPIALFNNANAKDGIFNYSNVRRDLQFNTVEVVYLDRFDNYKTKVEYIQDEQDIRKRGVFKTTINTSGVTSRSMARRIGQHIIYQTTKENQTVDFSAGLEALLCRPGDLIIIEDEMKTRSTNYGKILDVDVANKQLRIDNQFDTTQHTGFITVYTPTGYSTSSELNRLAKTERKRVEQFSINSNFFNNNAYSILTGTYVFSGYTDGFGSNDEYPDQFPLYTGTGSAGQNLYCYYSKTATGFVFATGLPFQNNNTYDKVITNTGVFFGADISSRSATNKKKTNYSGFAYSSSAPNKRTSPSGQISGAIDWDSDLYPVSQGILDEEINVYDISQITKISLTGYDNVIDYGSLIYLNANDPNVSFLPAVKAGSIYRIERKLASDQIYKIISIRENSQNEYGVTATRYDTGKFETIEKSITEDFLENTYYTGVVKVRNVEVTQVPMPQIAAFSGTSLGGDDFALTGRWTSGAGGSITGFSVSVSNSLAGVSRSSIVNATGIQFAGLTDIGNWEMSVTALAKKNNINSSAATTGAFIAYSGRLNAINKPAITGFSLQ